MIEPESALANSKKRTIMLWPSIAALGKFEGLKYSLGMLADAIHHAGYSDDPLYTFRILRAAQDPLMKRAVWQYWHRPPGEEREG